MDEYLNKVKASAWKECEDILDKENFDTIFERISKAIVKHNKDHPAHKSAPAPASGNKITISQNKRAPTAYAQHKATWFEENNYDKDDEIPHPDGTGEVFKRNDYFNKFIWGKMSDSEKKELNDKYGVSESKGKSPKKNSSTLNPLQVFDKRHRALFPDGKVEGLTSPDGAKIGLYRAVQIVWKEISENHPDIQKLYKKFSEETKSGNKSPDDLEELPHIPKDVFTKMDFQKIKLVQ